jgi:hypothetical protein
LPRRHVSRADVPFNDARNDGMMQFEAPIGFVEPAVALR